ncbi:MAG TPA: putative glycoside hydrolase [Longimicrobiaceae bacterium]
MRGLISTPALAGVLLLALAGCSDQRAAADVAPISSLAAASDSVSVAPPVDSAAAASAEGPGVETVVPPAPLDKAPAQIRGLYLNAYAAGSRRRLSNLIAIADTTEINAFVVDVKTEAGVHFSTQLPLAKELQVEGENTLRNLQALVDTLHNHGIYAIARIVVFKDPILSKAKPEWSIRTPDGSLWVDKAGNTWVSSWDENVWDYNISIAEEAARAGFDEIQFDYVRFPEPYASLPPQVHPAARGTRTDAIAAFLNEARRRLHPLGVIVAADVFGLSPNDPRDVNIGQQWETLASTADHILPMMYPSHYLPTHLPGVRTPDKMPYETVFKSAGMARLRNDRMREEGLKPARVIPWIQGFTATWLSQHLDYGPEELRKQKQAVYDVGFDDWIIWHPGSKYEHLVSGLERETLPRAAAAYEPPPEVLATVDLFESRGVREARQKAALQAKGITEEDAVATEVNDEASSPPAPATAPG